ncbi:MAG: 2-phosphosulfolactate phosphatase [Clostridia bacterium]
MPIRPCRDNWLCWISKWEGGSEAAPRRKPEIWPLYALARKTGFRLDDFLCAGMLLQQIMAEEEVQMADLGWNALLLYQAYRRKPACCSGQRKALSGSKGLGFHEGLEYCLMKNQLEIAPVFDGNEIRID